MAEATAVLERIDTPRTQEGPVDSFLITASVYLAEKRMAAWRPDSPEDWRMRLKGAELQHILAHHIMDNYSERNSLFLELRLDRFWLGYHSLLMEPLIKALIEKGLDPDRIPKNTGMDMVLGLQRGVRGMVAACFMAKACGWEIFFPSVEQDVKQGIDLFLRKGGQEAKLQVKCREGSNFMVTGQRKDQPILVVIPDETPFFINYKLGIPERHESMMFGRWLDNQLKGRR